MILSTLEKSLQLIEALSRNHEGLSLTHLSQLLGFPKSTVHHILSTFLVHDYIAQDAETKKYSLGFRFLSIGSRILDNLDIRRTAYAHLRKLHEKCNEAVHLSILRHGKVTYIDKIQKAGGLSLDTYIGFSTDPHAATGGKVLLSELTQEEVARIYRDRPLRAYGKNTITHLPHLLEQLNEIRSQGYAIDDEEYYEGVRCVAAPVRGGGKIVAAVSITGSIFSVTMERLNKELIGLIGATADDISAELRW
jgi:IclR family transcriptional regulator, KDG regulon repressor